MKADELMVGDIVLRKGKPVEIVSTSGIEYSFGQQDITIYQGNGNGLESHTMRGIAPMRITERLLVALGFASSTYTLPFSMAYCIFIRPFTCISSAIFLVYSLMVATFSSEM